MSFEQFPEQTHFKMTTKRCSYFSMEMLIDKYGTLGIEG